MLSLSLGKPSSAVSMKRDSTDTQHRQKGHLFYLKLSFDSFIAT